MIVVSGVFGLSIVCVYSIALLGAYYEARAWYGTFYVLFFGSSMASFMLIHSFRSPSRSRNLNLASPANETPRKQVVLKLKEKDEGDVESTGKHIGKRKSVKKFFQIKTKSSSSKSKSVSRSDESNGTPFINR